MAWKIDPKSIEKLIESTMKKRTHLGGVLEASWSVLGADKSIRGADSADAEAR